MEANLKQTFSDDEINEFYVDFATNRKNYEAINAHTMDIHYGFIDFPTFKENILMFKNGVGEYKGEEAKASDAAYQKTLSLMTENPQAKYWELCNEDVNDPKFQWTKMITAPEKNGFGIDVWKRPLEGSAIDITKTEAIMKGVNLDSVRKLSYNYEKYAFRVDKKNTLKSFKYIIKNDPKGYFLMQSHSKMGAMASDRELLCEIKLEE